jgi:hypothetical protein
LAVESEALDGGSGHDAADEWTSANGSNQS